MTNSGSILHLVMIYKMGKEGYSIWQPFKLKQRIKINMSFRSTPIKTHSNFFLYLILRFFCRESKRMSKWFLYLNSVLSWRRVICFKFIDTAYTHDYSNQIAKK